MEKDRGTKIIAILALLIAVVGLSVGFAAFSKELTITPVADVKADDSKFSVEFSKDSSSETAQFGDVNGEFSEDASDDENAKAGKVTIAQLTATNAEAQFSKDNQTIVYTWYVRNSGEMDAYLKSVTFGSTTAECTAKEEDTTTEALVNAACANVSLKLTIQDKVFTSTQSSVSEEVKLAKGQKDGVVKLEITAGEGATLTDGDYTAKFQPIVVEYTSKNPTA